jgi:hypothetical protein
MVFLLKLTVYGTKEKCEYLPGTQRQQGLSLPGASPLVKISPQPVFPGGLRLNETLHL